MDEIEKRMLEIIKQELVPQTPKSPVPNKIEKLRVNALDKWAEYTNALDLHAADRDDRWNDWFAANEEYVDACDSFREDPENWWVEQDAEDAKATVEL